MSDTIDSHANLIGTLEAENEALHNEIKIINEKLEVITEENQEFKDRIAALELNVNRNNTVNSADT